MKNKETLFVEILKNKNDEDLVVITQFKGTKCTGVVGSYKGQEAVDLYNKLTNLIPEEQK